MGNKTLFIVEGRKWFDKVNGNTYHAALITRVSDGKQLTVPFQYGYGDQYWHNAIVEMARNGWIPERYIKEPYMYERENNYPLYVTCYHTTKKELKEFERR